MDKKGDSVCKRKSENLEFKLNSSPQETIRVAELLCVRRDFKGRTNLKRGNALTTCQNLEFESELARH